MPYILFNHLNKNTKATLENVTTNNIEILQGRVACRLPRNARSWARQIRS